MDGPSKPLTQYDDSKSGIDTLFKFLRSVDVCPGAMGVLPWYYDSTMNDLTSHVTFMLKGEPWECENNPTYRALGLDPKKDLKFISRCRDGCCRTPILSAYVMFNLTVKFPGTEYEAIVSGIVWIIYSDPLGRGDFMLCKRTRLTELIMKTPCRGCGEVVITDAGYSDRDNSPVECLKNPLIAIGDDLLMLPVCEHCQLETERLAKLVLTQFRPVDKGLQKLLWRLIEARF